MPIVILDVSTGIEQGLRDGFLYVALFIFIISSMILKIRAKRTQTILVYGLLDLVVLSAFIGWYFEYGWILSRGLSRAFFGPYNSERGKLLILYCLNLVIGMGKFIYKNMK
jgi:hypothetical protein